MANKVLTRVWEHSEQRGAARCLLLAIADVANEHGIAWPGIPHLADMINETERHTYTLITKLVTSGELLHKPGGGRGRLTLYGVACGLSESQKARLNTVLQNSVFKNSVLENTVKTPPKTLNNSTPKYHRNGATERHETTIAKNDNQHDPYGVGGGDRARASFSTAKSAPAHVGYLASKGMGAAAEFAHLDPDSAIADFNARRADNIPIGTIVDQWRLRPPAPGAIYEQQPRPLQPESPPDRPRRSPVAARGKHAPTGGAELRDPGWAKRELAKLENGEL